MAEGKVEVQSINIASWNIMGKGSKGISEQRQRVLSSYLDQIKEGQCTFSIPDLVFLQEVPWAAKGDIVKGMLKGTSYSYTADSWVQEKEKKKEGKEKVGPYNVVLHNETRLTAYKGGRIPANLYQKLDEKRETAMEIYSKYTTEEQLQEAAKLDRYAEYVLEEFQDRDSIAYFNECFKNAQRAQMLLKDRIGVGIFELRYGEVKPKLISVSFHNRRPKEEPEKLLCLLLHFLKELCNLLKERYAVVLAGDFNMDVNKVETPHVKRLLLDFNPQEYTPTSHRGYLMTCIDNILLWDTRGEFALGPIQAHLIKVEAAGIPKDKREEMELRDSISNHDPLTAVLTIRSKPMVEEDQQLCDLKKLFEELTISSPPLDNSEISYSDFDSFTDDSTSADKSSDRSALYHSFH